MKIPSQIKIFALLLLSLAGLPTTGSANCLTLPAYPNNEVTAFVSVTWGVPLGNGLAPEYSFFNTTIQSVPSPAIPTGDYPTWCFDVATTIDPGGPTYYSTPGTTYDAFLISSCDPNLNSLLPNHPNVKVGSTTWNKINWLINNRLQACNGSVPTMWEVQSAIHILFGQVPPTGISVRQSVIDCLVNGANANPNFSPVCGQKIAVVLDIEANLDDLVPDVQLLFLEVPYCPDIVLTPGQGCFKTLDDALAAANTANQGVCGLSVSSAPNPNGACQVDITVAGSYVCGNTPKTKSITYTVTIDGAAPVITDYPTGGDIGCNPTEPTDDSVKALVKASETCSTATITVTHTDGGVPCAPTRTFTITASDACGNTSEPIQVTFNWKRDTAAPSLLTTPSGGDLGCNPLSLPTDESIKAQVTASDDCGTPTITVTHVDGGTVCAPTRTFTITASDACGNASQPSQVTYTWKSDIAAPTVSNVPTGGDLGCNPASLPTDDSIKAQLTALDNCDGNPAINVTHIDGGTACAPSRTFTITAKDACGNASQPQQITYTWKADTAAPTLGNVPTGGDLGCNPATPTLPTDASITAQVTAQDDCDGHPTITVTHVDGGTACAPSRTFTITAKDACGNVSEAKKVTYTWKSDTIAPSLIATPKGGDLGCNPATTPSDDSLTAQVTASDDCDNNPTIKVTHVDGGTACAPSRTFTITATDSCGNSSQAVQVTYTWKVDTTPPTITCPPDYTSPTPQILKYCTYTQGGWGACPRGSNPAMILAKNFATVYPGGFVEIGIPGASGYSMKFKSQLAIQNYLPAGGTPNALTGDLVNPTSSPAGVFGGQVLALQLNVDFSKAGIIGGSSGSYGDMMITDATSPFNGQTVGDVLKAANILLGGGSVPGLTISQLNDICDKLNQAFDNCTTSTWASTHCGSQTAGTTGGTTGGTSDPGVATATDNCDPNPTITYTDEVVSIGCTAILRTWKATDACGNVATCAQKINISDKTPPVLTIPSSVSVQCLSQVQPVGQASATDNSDPNPTVTYLGETSTGTDCNKVITRTWKATDACGNTTTKSQTITVKDTIPPVITGIGKNLSYECPAPVTPVWSTPTATDNCGGPVTLTYVDSQTALCANSYCLKRTWTAKDECGNVSTACQTITVTDTTPPAIVCPANAQVACGGDTSPASTGMATAIDSCSGPVTPTYKDSSCTDLNGNTVITRVWTAQDACGNCSKCTQTITVAKCTTGCYETYTPGGWGAPPNGYNIAQRLAYKFSTVYPGGCVYIGLPGSGNYLKFTSAAAIQGFLPYGGTPNKLSGSFTNPTGTTSIGAGEFASQVLALELNVDFSNKGIIKPGLAGLKVAAGNKLAGKTVAEVLAIANTALGGGALPAGCTYADLTDLLSKINGNYDNGTSNNGYLVP